MCDSKSMLLGLSNGHLQVISWNAEVHGNVFCYCFSMLLFDEMGK